METAGTPNRRAGIYRAAISALRLSRRELDQRDRRIARLEERLAQMARVSARNEALSATSAMVEGGLGNRPSLESYRNISIARLMTEINDLGLVARSEGPEVARFLARTRILADLAVVYAAPPASVQEARRRDLVQLLFSDPAIATVLAGGEPWHERFREDVIAVILRSGVEVSTWELVRRSAETSVSESARST